MPEKIDATLRDGTLVRHKNKGYQGKIEGTTSIKLCFTKGGVSLQSPVTKDSFQYRIMIAGEAMRQIAPLEDLEILDVVTEIKCGACQKSFYTRPGLVGKPGGRCACGGWICLSCSACQTQEGAQNNKTSCTYQRRIRKLAIKLNRREATKQA